MVFQGFFFLLLLIYFSVETRKFNCSSPTEFEEANLYLKSEDYLRSTAIKTTPLHRYLFEKGEFEITFTTEIVQEMKIVNKNVVVKKVSLNEGSQFLKISNEIHILRIICGQDYINTPKLSFCKYKAVVGFFGCVEDETDVFLFYEGMKNYASLDKLKEKYFEMPPVKRAESMLNIIDKFIELHKLRIVHSDIKPQKILADESSISDFKISGFEFSGFANEYFIDGTIGYLPPDKYGNDKYNWILRYKDDIFFLGMTFAEMEGNFKDTREYLIENCFGQLYSDYHCGDRKNTGLNSVFTIKRELHSFIEIMK